MHAYRVALCRRKVREILLATCCKNTGGGGCPTCNGYGACCDSNCGLCCGNSTEWCMGVTCCGDGCCTASSPNCCGTYPVSGGLLGGTCCQGPCCGDNKCCNPGMWCRDPDPDPPICCLDGAPPCEVPERCCEVGGTCCPSGDRCCPAETTCCGVSDCCTSNEECCDGQCSPKGACCNFDNGSCQVKGQHCCNLTGGVFLGSGTTCTPSDLCRPRCEDCTSIQETIAECDHLREKPEGAPCSTTGCLENLIDTASCKSFPERIGPPDCNTRRMRWMDQDGYIHVEIGIWQIFRRDVPCPAQTIEYEVVHPIYEGCEYDCQASAPIEVACTVPSCTGGNPDPPIGRAIKNVCGCD
jgi:hypothetical protein